MGSSGGNTFGNYSPSRTTRCDDSIDAGLEDVARHEYYQKKKSLPSVGTAVVLMKGIASGRLVVADAASQLVIGSLPTSFNYLLICQQKDYKYEGEVTQVKAGKIPTVEVHLDSV